MTSHSRWPLLFLAVQFVCVGTFLYATERLEPRPVNDTDGYVEFSFDSPAAALNNFRTPGYPLFLRAVGWISAEHRYVPTAHFVCFCVGVLVFYFGLRSLGLNGWCSALIAGSLLSTNILHGYVETLV